MGFFVSYSIIWSQNLLPSEELFSKVAIIKAVF